MTDIAMELLRIATTHRVEPQHRAVVKRGIEEIVNLRSENRALRSRVDEAEARIVFLEGGPMPKPKAPGDALDELSRLGQEMDAQLSDEDREAIMLRLTKGRGVHGASAE